MKKVAKIGRSRAPEPARTTEKWSKGAHGGDEVDIYSFEGVALIIWDKSVGQWLLFAEDGIDWFVGGGRSEQ